jgi:hypothetical protein
MLLNYYILIKDNIYKYIRKFIVKLINNFINKNEIKITINKKSNNNTYNINNNIFFQNNYLI